MSVLPERMISEVLSLLDRNQANSAVLRLTELIDSLGRERLSLLSPDLRRVIDRFYPKKRRDLLEHLDKRLAGTSV